MVRIKMSGIRRIILAVMAVMIAVSAIGMGVEYNTDWNGDNAPFISEIDPAGGKVTVTNPGDTYVGRVLFIDRFGRHIKNFKDATLKAGEDTVFNISLPNRGNIGLHTMYFDMPTEPGALGVNNNDDLSGWNVIAWLPASSHPGKVYKRGVNGIWGWV